MPSYNTIDLPQEILELVVDEVARSTGSKVSDQEVNESIQSCSSVSHAFRHRAYCHLFSTFCLAQHPFLLPTKFLSRLCALREVLHSAQELGMHCLLFYARSFSLLMDGGVLDAYTILENEDVSQVMRMMHKYSSVLQTISFGASNIPIFWPDLTKGFQESFRELSQAPTVNTLALFNITGLPAMILRGTNVQHIKFHMVKVINPELAFWLFLSFPQNNQFTSMDIDYTFPFPHSGVTVSDGQEILHLTEYTSKFFGIKKLKYTLYYPQDFRRFTGIALALQSLEEVHIVYSDTSTMFLQSMGQTIPFSDFPGLRTLQISHNSQISVGTSGPLLKVHDLLAHSSIPCTVEKLVLGFAIRTSPPWLMLSELLPESQTWILFDELLTSRRFNCVKLVEFRLQYTTLQAEPWVFDEKNLREGMPYRTQSRLFSIGLDEEILC